MSSETFNFTDQEFLDVINQICDRDTPIGQTFDKFESLDEKLATDKLDSLAMVIMFTWLTELFGINEDLVDPFVLAETMSLRDLKEFIMEHATQTYTYATAQEYMECF